MTALKRIIAHPLLWGPVGRATLGGASGKSVTKPRYRRAGGTTVTSTDFSARWSPWL